MDKANGKAKRKEKTASSTDNVHGVDSVAGGELDSAKKPLKGKKRGRKQVGTAAAQEN